MRNEICPNYNHKHANAPVRYCPNCGNVVNGNIPYKRCKEEQHAESRRNRNKYCVNCGKQLIQGR